MSSIRNKRQQARNERILQDLIKSVPGNDRCADCGTRNPAWASWSLGIFLCIRCASLHRKLGTHISKIKSISMDMWTNEQIDNMRSRGNVISNTVHNPDASKHPVPLNGEDSDSLMERYIRSKYEYKSFMRETVQPQNSSTSSISSGASSSTSGLSLPSSASSNSSFPSSNASTSSARITAPPTRSVSTGYVASRNPPARTSSPSPSSSSKVSQVLGLGSMPYTDARQAPPVGPVVFPHGMVTAPPYQEQLQSLKDMGFKDERKIMEVLKSVNGKIIEASEILLRLGNNGSSNSPPITAGISIQKSGGSVNPFDALDRDLPPLPPGATEVGGIKPQNVPPRVVPQQPQQQQTSVGYQSSYQTQAPAPVASLGGGYQWFDTQQQQGQQQVNGNAAYGQLMQGQDYQGFAQQPQQQMQAPQTNPYTSFTAGTAFSPTPATAGSVNMNGGIGGYNPFLSNSAPPMQKPYNPPVQPAPQNPYLQLQQTQQQQEQLRQQQLQQQQAQQQIQQQAQQQVQAQVQAQAQAQFQQQQAPYNSQQWPPTSATLSYPQQPQMNPYQSNLQAQQSLMPQRAVIDKSSILALYNYPQLAPPPNGNPAQQQQQESQVPVSNAPQNLATRFVSGGAVSAPVTNGVGSNNPFLPSAPLVGGVGGGRGHMSQESVDFGAWQSGRHSPDAFASLSFRQ
ncbi:unnamed protein product [Tuber aestivum]|uniref:Arf-GAP domain-containing protein n=1 Tax=Tuber aestivum TaxID=59557 RepID=A0A292PKQ0_9PEZI|nr:unnamed protein product [Tuber aestivum]